MLEYTQPKYFTVKRSILRMLDSGELEANAALPSERELMLTHNVSRITVRKAIEELEQEGLVYKIQGKGTFVKGGQKQQDLISITSCTEDVRRQGMIPSRQVIFGEVIDADKKRQSRLQLAKGEKVFHMARVYYADGEPINHTTVYLPYKLFPGIEDYDFSKFSLYGVIENDYGVKIVRAERTLEAVMAYPEICEYLHVHPGVPLILFHCITYGEVRGKELPIESFKCYYRSDRFKFCIDQVRKDKFDK